MTVELLLLIENPPGNEVFINPDGGTNIPWMLKAFTVSPPWYGYTAYNSQPTLTPPESQPQIPGDFNLSLWQKEGVYDDYSVDAAGTITLTSEDTIYKKLELGVQNIQAADSDMDTFFLADN